MQVFVLTVAVFAVAFVGMAVGVIFSNRRIRGSCGGLANLEGKYGKMACADCPSGGQNCSGSHKGAQEHEPEGPGHQRCSSNSDL